MRIESRAKSALELSMSHSLSDPERSWDVSLGSSDFVALVVCHHVGTRPIDWNAEDLVQYVSVGELRSAQADGRSVLIRPKGAEEGFESRMTWPAVVARSPGTLESVTSERIRIRRGKDNRIVTLRLFKMGKELRP